MLRPIYRRTASSHGASSSDSQLSGRIPLLFSFFSTSNSSRRKMKNDDNNHNSACQAPELPSSRKRATHRRGGSVHHHKMSVQQGEGSYGSPTFIPMGRSLQTVIPQQLITSPDSLTCGIIGGSEKDAKMLPFSICRTKSTGGPVMLKKSLLEINRERKVLERAKNDLQYVYLSPGMVLLKRFIMHEDQVKIIEKCQELGSGLGGFYRPGYNDGAKLHLQMMCLGMNWDPQSRQYEKLRQFDGAESPKIPEDFMKLVNEAITSCRRFLAQSLKDVNEVPYMEPDVCIVNFYDKSGRLGLHQDKDESIESLDKGLPVVSFSLGDSADFQYGIERDVDSAKNVKLESGDVLIFGGKSRLIYHGVSSILSGTAPKFLMEKTGMRPGRLNLTFRKF